MHSNVENRSSHSAGVPTSPSSEIIHAVQTHDVLSTFNGRLRFISPQLIVTPSIMPIHIIVLTAKIANGVAPLTPTIEHLLDWGANYGPRTSTDSF